MPNSRRQESGPNNLARARFAQYTQSSQEDDALDLSVTRSPDKWHSRIEARSSSAIDDEEFHDMQEADFIPSPLVNVIESPDNLLN